MTSIGGAGAGRPGAFEPDIPGTGSEAAAAPAPAAAPGQAPPATDPTSRLFAPTGRLARPPAGGPLGAFAETALAAGRATRKSRGPEGTEALIQPVHASRVDCLVRSARPEVASALAADLGRITGEGADVRRALYLKAAGARVDALLGGDPRAREAALETLACFGRSVASLSAAGALGRATVSDLDSGVSTSGFEPSAWDEKRGVIHDKSGGDERTDNDGLLQRFMESCGTTTLQIALCEDDPVRAFAAHGTAGGTTGIASDDVVAAFQREVLAEMKSPAIPRRADFMAARVKNGIGRLRATGGAAGKDLDALRAHIRESGPLTKGAARALESLRKLAGGFPTDAEIAEVRRGPLGKEGGLTTEEFGQVLGKHLTPATGARYEQVISEDAPKKDLARSLDRAAEALRSGVDVPMGISEPGHWMLMAAVDGEGAARRFLLTDPWTGRTGWVKDQELISGKFIAEPFGLEEPKKIGYIDSMFLPAMNA